MSQRYRRISRLVGLSTERQPSALRTGESPRLRNVDLDRGGVAVARPGFSRLSDRPFRDASWRLRGAPWVSGLTRTEFHDYLLIPHTTYMDVVGSAKFFLAFRLRLTKTPLGSYGGDPEMIVNKGTDADVRFRLTLNTNAGTRRWSLTVYDTGLAATTTIHVNDAGVGPPDERYIEVGDLDNSGECSLRVWNAITGVEVGTSQTTGFGGYDLGSLGAADAYPWLFAAWPASDGYGPEFDLSNLSSGEAFGAFAIAEIRFEAGYSAFAFLQKPDGVNVIEARKDDIHDREVTPIEYAEDSVVHYYRCNEARYGQLIDLKDGSHGIIGNVGPTWLTKLNTFAFDVSQNPDIASNYAGAELVNEYALLFNGFEGLIHGRTGDISHTSAAEDPLVNVFQQAPASGVGWTLELLWTFYLRAGQTAHPDAVIYASSPDGTLSVNPIRISIVSDQFKLEFDDGTSTKSVTLTTYNVSDYAGERVTIVAHRTNQFLTLIAVGENKEDTAFVVSAATAPTVTSSTAAGPFMMIGRQVDNFTAATADDPADYTTRAVQGIFHELRFWSRPLPTLQIAEDANAPVPVGSREGLVIYLVPDTGEGNRISNFGRSVNITVTNASGSYPTQQTPVIDNRILPPPEQGPQPYEGLVETFKPVPCTGAEDLRTTTGDAVSRQLLLMAGASLYGFDLATNELKVLDSGLFKRDQLFDSRVFARRAIFANGERPYVFSRGKLRRAGIRPPTHRAIVNIGAGGTTPDGDYYLSYRWLNSRDGVYSAFAPLRKFTLGSGNNTISSIGNIETPNDPQVDTLEIFTSIPGGATTSPPGVDADLVAFLYRLVTTSDTLGVLKSTTYTPSAGFADLSNDVNSLSGIRFDHVYRNGVPPGTRAIELFGTRILYGAQNQPGTIFFSRIDGGIQPEHVDLTPGLEASISIDVDAADTIQAIVAESDAAVVYGRDTRAEITQSGLDPATTGGFEVPFELKIRDFDKGCVSPAAVAQVTGTHVFLHENDVLVRADREYRFLSSPPEQVTAAPQANIGRTIRELDRSKLWRAVVMNRDARQQVWIAVSRNGDRNDTVLVYSYRDRKWALHTIPVDYMIEVEAADDGNIPIGIVNGYVCRLDHVGIDIDGYVATADQDGKTFDGYQTTVSLVVGGSSYINLAGTPTEQLRFQNFWLGKSGKWHQFRCNRYEEPTGGTRRVYYEALDANAPTPAANDVIYFGSRCPSIDVILKPVTATSFKAFRLLEIAPGEEGWDTCEINAWFGGPAIVRDPSVDTAEIKGQSLDAAGDEAWIIGDIMGGGHVARIQLVAPALGAKFSIADMNATYDERATGFVDG